MKISLRDFQNVESEIRHVEVSETWPSLEFKGQTIEFPQDVAMDFHLERQEDVLRIEGTVTAVMRLACSRCTKEFDLRLSASTSEQISLRPDDDVDGQWDSSFMDSERGQLDLSEYALLLLIEQLPLQPLCRTDCAGLCPVCGQDLNQGKCDCASRAIDPRMAVLGKLLSPDSK